MWMSKHKRMHRDRGLLALFKSSPVRVFQVSVILPGLQALTSSLESLLIFGWALMQHLMLSPRSRMYAL